MFADFENNLGIAWSIQTLAYLRDGQRLPFTTGKKALNFNLDINHFRRGALPELDARLMIGVDIH